MILLDYKDRRPLYEQIVDKFSDMILKGVLKPDEKLPSVRNLAMELSINPNTIQRAYMELEHKGFLYSVKGRGNFVSDSSVLKEERRQEIKEKLAKHLREACIHGIKQEEIEKLIQSVYECVPEKAHKETWHQQGIAEEEVNKDEGGKKHD